MMKTDNAPDFTLEVPLDEVETPELDLDTLLETAGVKSGEIMFVLTKDSDVHRALKMTEGVRKLIDFGGGNLRLADGSVWRLFPACFGCGNADRMKLGPNEIHLKYCARCATEKVFQYDDLCK